MIITIMMIIKVMFDRNFAVKKRSDVILGLQMLLEREVFASVDTSLKYFKFGNGRYLVYINC